MFDAQLQDCTQSPLAADLVRFNLLISRLFHPTREREWLPSNWPALQAQDVVHRHASGALLRDLNLGWVQRLDDPMLPICMAAQALFEELTVCCGLLVIGPAVRRVILQVEVASLDAQLGAPALAFARGAAGRIAPLAVEPPPSLEADPRAQALRLGGAMLCIAMRLAPLDIGRRGRLRLPVDAEGAEAELPAFLSDPARALGLSRDVLNELDPAWLSSFPAPH